MTKKSTLGSLFDGIGGFPFCAELSGIKPIWAAEIEPACVAVTKRHFPNMEHLGSVTDIDGAKIPPVDIITFGSPCQDLSVAGKQAGLDGERSGLFKEAIRIIYEMRSATNGKYPTFIVWENVPGAFSSHKGRNFQTVLSEITKTDIPMPASGRWAKAGVVRGRGICAAWRLLDAQYWGVPQRRKRIYLIGSFGSNSAEEILFERDRVRRYLAPCRTQGQGIKADTENSVGSGGFESNSVIYDARGNGDGKTAPTITGDHNNRVTDYSSIVVMATQQGGAEIAYNLCPTITAAAGMSGNNQPVVCYSAGFKGGAGAKAGGVGFEEEKSPTLMSTPSGTNATPTVVYAIDRAAFNQGENAIYDFEISDSGINSTLVSKGPSAVAYQFVEWIVRRLTPTECERLQGYPDGWTKIPKMETMSDADYELFKKAYMLDKQIRGKKVKAVPTREQLLKWYNKLECDGTRYKQLGNSLAIPCALRVIGGIAEHIHANPELLKG